MKTYKGKAIYNPSGKAGEYSYWAANFHVGCSNGCEYCYCKKGILAGVMGQEKPQLKACFKNEQHALEVFEKELNQNLTELQKHGLFFSFTTDPMLISIKRMTYEAVKICGYYSIPVKILTKRADFISPFTPFNEFSKNLIALGFTLTGHDELEPGASTNAERIEAMKKLHDAGFITFASIEPVIDFESSLKMIQQSHNFCDLYKIGLESGRKYDIEKLRYFAFMVKYYLTGTDVKIYFKDSLLKAAGINRDALPANCVTRDYNIFSNL